ncbi:MAG: isoleucine--tRNA ligase [Candidatus Omnitrophota bacterium]
MGQTENKTGYKDTLNLPKTAFPMKADLARKEPRILKIWEETGIYGRIMDKRKGAEKSFILHDGPPYANGHIHMGHVLNKTLKDIYVKYFTMTGHRAPYIPGWDCHGLPVEHQLLKELNITKHQIDQVAFRRKAYRYAMKFVGIQAEEFKRLGVFGDWDNPYLTLTKEYEADVLEALSELYGKGYIYKDRKPVNWCKRCETALAEAEVEYADKKSPSVFVKFRVKEFKFGEGMEKWVERYNLIRDTSNAYFVIWTTTPWTLMANRAVALNPDEEYVWLEGPGGDALIVASKLKDRFLKICNCEEKTSQGLPGRDLEGAIYEHPFIDGQEGRVVLADYVSMEDGTGCVHTAPGHGQDDYNTGRRYGLEIFSPVDDAGRFTHEAGEFAGRDILEANGAIIDKMRRNGALIKEGEVEHSYPHCWRCKEPIIYRATEQWFLNVDHLDLRGRIIKAINEDVEWVPEAGRERISSMVKLRPDWCLSRQRYWGVPIPAFRCAACGETFTDSVLIKKVAGLVREKGADIWFEKDAEDLLPGGTTCKKCGNTVFKKEDDILDVWFDSGVSHKAVLERREGLSSPADLYLEGSDQHRGWFQSSIITSVAANGRPPYRRVLTHGFVVDGEGKKMSKSTGNVISPQDIMKEYGADILRLWVASSDYEGDIKISGEILERLADGYRKIRNTFRFLVSNLYDFNPSKDAVEVDEMPEMDRWMLSRLSGLFRDVSGYYEKWELHKVYRAVYDFCVYEVSSFYLDVSKDTVYIVAPGSCERRFAQTVIFNILSVLSRVMAPMIPFTAEEIWGYMSFDKKEESIHLTDWPDIAGDMARWEDAALDDKWRDILSLRGDVMKLLEVKRGEGLIGSSLEGAIRIYPVSDKMRLFTRENLGLFRVLFKVSQAEALTEDDGSLEDIPGLGIKIGVVKASGEKCRRCWNFSGTVGIHKEFPDLCERCYNVIAERSGNGFQEKNG